MKKNIILILIFFLSLSLIVYYSYNVKKEGFESPGFTRQKQIADLIYFNFRPDMNYSEYLKILINSNNTSFKILEQEVFYYFKRLQNDKELTIEKIIREIK